ncbi:hypothetical protein [Escherichia coli]|uniref:hypothetical protein n=1 Tax=Escherichia coli TaxID=562 RepID=UPI00385FE19A
MPAFEWVHVQLHQQKGMISLSPPTICNSAQSGSTVQSLAGESVQLTDQNLLHENYALKAEIELVKALLREKELLLAEKDKRNEDLKQALLLIESKLPATPEPVTQPMVKKSWKFWKK